MSLFIDTNIFLSFYHLTSEDLEELQKLVVLIKNKELTLYLPEQVIEETWRNRASKINDSLGPFKKERFTVSYPAYCKDYDEYEAMQESLKAWETLHSSMIKKIQVDVDNRTLLADKLLKTLFSIAKNIPRTKAILQSARARIEVGNPPGKKGSLGDAINWESLLSEAYHYNQLVIISDDNDLSSPLNTNNLNEYLHDEWLDKTLIKPILFRKLSQYFKKYYPNINLATEAEKDQLITALAESPNFSNTHLLIANLSKYNDYTIKQSEDLINIALINNQVRWIVGDDDVYNFYSKILENLVFVNVDGMEELEGLLAVSKVKVSTEDIPF